MSRTHQALTSLALLIGGALGLTSPLKSASAAPLLYEQPLSKKYHRLEVVVPVDFKVSCTSKPLLARCGVSLYTPELLRLFQLGTREGVKIEANQARKEVNFIFDDPKMRLQEKLLDGPPRWVIEVGYDETLIQPIEDELPFRPYPMPVQTVRLPRPNMAIEPLVGEGEEITTFNRCWALYNAKSYVDAYKECNQISTVADADRPTARAATRLIGEIFYTYLKQETSSNQDLLKHIGTLVLVRGEQVSFDGRPVKIGYTISGGAESATLSVTNLNGVKIYQAQVPVGAAGKPLQVEWSGQESSGSDLPPGIYGVEVTATPSAEETQVPKALTYVEGKVEGVRFDKGIPEFLVNGRRVRTGEVVIPGLDKVGADEGKGLFISEDPNTPLRDIAVARLKKAERAAASDREKARYVLLTADLLYNKSANEAIEYLRSSQARYRQTEAEPFLLAERARLLLDSSDYDEAKRVLEDISKLDTQQEYVMGSRLLALASLAYAKGDFTNATALYDEARESFPELLLAEPGPLFQVAELYFRSRRLEEARPFYQEFLDRFKSQVPHWVARIRLAQINSFERPQEAFGEMQKLSESLAEPEGKQLAALYSLTLSTNSVRGVSPESIFKMVQNGNPSDYVLEELWMQQARNSLQEDKLQEAFELSQKIVENASDSALLRDSSLFFQRLLLLEADLLLREGRNVDLVILYYKEKNRRFRLPACRALLHLYVARAMRDLKMLNEAATQVISKGGLPGVRDPNIEALLNLEFTGILREKVQDGDLTSDAPRDPSAAGEVAAEDVNRFKQAVDSLEARFPKRFDTYDYWASLGFYQELQGQLRLAKDIYLYALNGPTMTPQERISLARSIYQVYMKMPDYDKALYALKVLLDIHDEYKRQLNMPYLRVNTLWKRVELHIQREAWAELIPAIQDYLDESQVVISTFRIGTPQTTTPEQREQSLFQSSVELERRQEALFYQGFAFLKLQDDRSAKRIWDLLHKESPNSVYGELAEYELFMLSWRDQVKPEVFKMIEP